jgi:hypothetical protein
MDRLTDAGVSPPLPTGVVVAICELTWWYTTDIHRKHVTRQQLLLGDWSIGRYAWELPVVYRVPEPIPVRGLQGIWNWDAPEEVTEYLSELSMAEADWTEQMNKARERL